MTWRLSQRKYLYHPFVKLQYQYNLGFFEHTQLKFHFEPTNLNVYEILSHEVLWCEMSQLLLLSLLPSDLSSLRTYWLSYLMMIIMVYDSQDIDLYILNPLEKEVGKRHQ